MGETLNSKCLPTLTKIGVFRHHSWKIFAPVSPFKRQMFEYKDCTIKYSKQWGLKKTFLSKLNKKLPMAMTDQDKKITPKVCALPSIFKYTCNKYRYYILYYVEFNCY